MAKGQRKVDERNESTHRPLNWKTKGRPQVHSKNPCSHRDVKMSFYEAFEKIVVASNILKIIEESTMDNKIKE
jgi:hypothetical protein